LGTFLSITPQPDEDRSSPPSTIQEIMPQHESLLDINAATVSALVCPRPLRRFSRATNGLDVFASIQAAQTSGALSKLVLGQQTDENGVDQVGLPPQQ
jgi:hypothetical protein